MNVQTTVQCNVCDISTSAVYKRKRMGPRTLPWGTPQVTAESVDTSPAKLTVCEWFVMNDWIQTMTDPRIANGDCKWSSRIWWSTVLKAADRSSNGNSATCPRSQARSKSETIFITAVSVECCCRYADWWLGSRECSWMNTTSWRWTSLSTVFDMNVKFEIGS